MARVMSHNSPELIVIFVLVVDFEVAIFTDYFLCILRKATRHFPTCSLHMSKAAAVKVLPRSANDSSEAALQPLEEGRHVCKDQDVLQVHHISPNVTCHTCVAYSNSLFVIVICAPCEHIIKNGEHTAPPFFSYLYSYVSSLYLSEY